MPLIVSIPVVLSYDPLIPFWEVKERKSPSVNPLLMVTVALDSSMSSASAMVMVLSIILLLSFSV